MALTDSLIFDLLGILTTSQGSIPIFMRSTPANAESIVNGSWKLQPASAHQPRFTSTGALLLEGASTNMITYARNINHPSWVKGSSIIPTLTPVQGMDNNYTATRIAVSQYAGNQAAQTMTKAFVLGSGQTYTVAWYLSLASGARFGKNDAIKIAGDVVAPQTVLLAPIFNDKSGNFIPVQVTFTTAGTAAGNSASSYAAGDTARNVNLQLYVENATSIDVDVVNMEPGTIRTSPIYQDAQTKTRDSDFLQYAKSPIAGLSSFLHYLRLENWAGDGVILSAGNFSLTIVNGILQVVCGSTTLNDTDPLPAAAQIAVRVSLGLTRISLYINGVMKAKATLTGYSGNTSTMTIGGVGQRLIRCLYFFNRDVGDGSIDVGQTVLGELLDLHNQDSLFSDLAEGHSRIVLPAIMLRTGTEQAVRFPQFQSASQPINTIATGSGKVAQVETVRIDTIVSASAAQTDYIVINNSQYTFTSDATPTTAEIAAGLAGAVNASPRSQPVTAQYVSGNTFTLTADNPGDDFALSVSGRLSRYNTTPNATDSNTFTVPNATDFVIGAAQIFRANAFITDVAILAINTGTNQLTVRSLPNSNFALIQQGDVIMQPSWSLRVGPNNYLCHHLEDYPEVKPSSKSLFGFRLRNNGLVDRVVTPYAKVTL